jgi:hypothetical protein
VAVADGGKNAMTEDKIMKSNFSIFLDRKVLSAVLAVALFCAPAIFPAVQSNQKAPAAQSAQKGFATAKEAAAALIQAAEKYDVPALLEILGPDGKDLVSSDDPVRDKTLAVEWAAQAKVKQSVDPDPSNKNRATLSVGTDDDPYAIPIVKRSGKWYFDSKAGHEEILYRRIGANELNVIELMHGFVEAQTDYASTIHDNSGINQYAQKLISTPGKQDGLYWVNADGTPGGPITEGVARAIEQGYSLAPGSAYSGYYYRLLKGQGPAAPLGELDYVIKGIMIGGFALVAVPTDYRVTGVMTFMVSNDGIVCQKDLGPDSLNVVKQMERYNPDKTWTRVDK